MARYFFHLTGSVREKDDRGIALPNLEAARLEAVRYAGELLAGEPDRLWEEKQWRVEVTDRRGVLLCTVITLAIDAPTPAQQAGSTPIPKV